MAIVSQPPDTRAAREHPAQILEIVRDTFRELRPEAAGSTHVALSSSLDRDLGFDSLARVELLSRVEHAFGVPLGEEVLTAVETPADLLAALENALQAQPTVVTPTGSPTPQAGRRPAPEPVTPAGEWSQPRSAATLLDVLSWHVQRHPHRVQILHVSDRDEKRISYEHLWERACALAAGLRTQGLGNQDTVAIMLPTCPEYFYTYWGVLLAGGIPVPIYPPTRRSQIEEHVRRHAGILSNAQAALLVTQAETRGLARLLKAQVPTLRAVTTATELMRPGGDRRTATSRGDDIAFLQYTSGSTGNPKGVVLTHANLLANIRAIGQALQLQSTDVVVSWLPLYHDMGLISTWLASLYFGLPIVVMSPMAFLARPASWLRAIQQYRGTLSAAPNFAYELCIKRIADGDVEGLDLSSWRVAANGAEQVSADTIERFQQRFGRYGFRAEAMKPVYGLAEATVGLLVPPLTCGPVIDRVQRQRLVEHGRAVPAAADDAHALRFVGCGRPLPGHQVRIVDNRGNPLPERVEGRLEFKGPSATRGYYRNAELSAQLFDGDWLDSGDRAYFAGGDYFLTGRVKDIVIRGGHHLYPDEVEHAVGALPGVRKGCVAVFGSPSPETGTERLVILAETRVSAPPQREALRAAIVRATVELLGEPPDDVVLAPLHAVLKTSSGKIRRSATRALYEAGRIGSRARPPWLQLLSLSGAATRVQLQQSLRRAGELLFAAYALVVFALLAPSALVATIASRHADRAWRINRRAAALFLRLTGIRLLVVGLDHLPTDQRDLLVVNHSSYLDGLVLMAAVPKPHRFVAKKELLRSRIARSYLQHLGSDFVERFAIRESVVDAERVMRRVAAGYSIAYFPEGTFRAEPGLLPFHLGAFVAAVKTTTPIVPVSIRGTRAILRDDRWFLRRGIVTVTIAKPIMPQRAAGTVFSEAVRLRDETRAAILAHCGEADAGAI
jgi:1-acyl-sn-glycerol-3-phosphate acyltransferase